MRKIFFILGVLLLLAPLCPAATPPAKDHFMILCYHDVPKDVNLNVYSVDQASFVQQLEYLRTHGYTFISLQDVVDARDGKKALPDKAVLLTFDDAYKSFYDFVYPLLKLYNCPCVLAVVTSWIDKPPPDVKEPLMSWEQLREVSQSPLVTIASHSHDLHQAIVYNPQGNKGPAASSRLYDSAAKTYETDELFRRRVENDLGLSRKIIKEKIGVETRSLVWPYGQANELAHEAARKNGFDVLFSLEDQVAHVQDAVLPRFVILDNPAIADFLKALKQNFVWPVRQRVLHADLDLIYDPDPQQQEKNLDAFIERVFTMKVNTVYLQAFCDDNGDGNIAKVYFPNRVLPVKADLFSRVVNQLFIRGVQVYAWMPMMSVVLPDAQETQSLRVQEMRDGQKRSTTSWYQRLSPFSPAVRRKMVMLYEDMAANARISGVVFLDDGYLNDFEDFSPEGLTAYKKITNGADIPYGQLNEEQQKAWTRLKTKTLIDFTDELKKAVLRYRPNSLFARTLYAQVLLEPESEEWFAQNFADSLKAYDYVVIMAYPRMERARAPLAWLKRLVREAKKYPGGLEKTVFKIQAYDWAKKQDIDPEVLDKWLRVLVASGAEHVGYYPDNYVDNRPAADIIRRMMSSEDFPFQRKFTVKDWMPKE